MKNNRFVWVTLLSTLLISPLTFALQRIPVTDNDTVSIRASSADFNKIYIDGDRITNVMGTANAYLIQSDNNLGQIYIKPVGAGDFRLNLTTEQGNAYQLVVHVTNQSPDTIELQPPVLSPTQAQNWESQTPYEQTVVRLIEAMATGSFPDGYQVSAATDKVSLPLGKVASVTLISRYVGSSLEGDSYLVTNLTNQPLQLTPAQLYRPNTMAISLQTQVIAAKAQTRLFIVKPRSA